MPKPITKAEQAVSDWSPPEWDGEEICNETFHANKKLAEMSDSEKDALYKEYLLHSKTVVTNDIAELTPTLVYDASVLEARKKAKARMAKIKTLDLTEKGIIVEGEDYDVLKSLLGEEEAKKRMSKPICKTVSSNDVRRKELSSKTAAERDAMTRFDRL